MTFPSIFELHDIFFNENSAIAFLIDQQIILPRNCEICLGNLSIDAVKKRYRCYKCKKQISLFSKTFFSKIKLSINKALFLGYLWLSKCPATTIYNVGGFSKATVTTYNQYLRNLVADSLDEENYIIGGPNIIVELDESKLGKRKYNRGRRVNFFY